MRQIYNVGGFGKPDCSESNCYHSGTEQIDSFRGWRIGRPPQLCPTHSYAFYIAVDKGSFNEGSYLGLPCWIESFKETTNLYKNQFAAKAAIFRINERVGHFNSSGHQTVCRYCNEP
jgi:hypothetical protein